MLPKLKCRIFYKENNLDTAIWQPRKGGDVGEKNPGSLEGENDSQILSSTKLTKSQYIVP